MKSHNIYDLQNEVFSKLEETVQSANFNGSRSHRTELLKDALCQLGHKNKYVAYATGAKDVKTEFHEWLWDLVWVKQARRKFRESGYYAIVELPLIAEIEWGTSEADRIDDFEKLRFGVADLRLFICGSEDVGDAEKAVELCRDRLCESGAETKAHYLLVAINWKCNKIDKCEDWVR